MSRRKSRRQGAAPTLGHSGRQSRPLRVFSRAYNYGKIRCRFWRFDARNGADCTGCTRGQAKGSGAKLCATGFESTKLWVVDKIECGSVNGALGQTVGRECRIPSAEPFRTVSKCGSWQFLCFRQGKQERPAV